MGVFESSIAVFLAPIKEYLADESVSEVMINGPKEIWVERKGKLMQVPVEFHDAIRMAVEYVKHDSPDVPVLMPNGKTPTAIQVVTDLGLEDLVLADEVYDDGDDAPYGRPSA